MFNPKIKLDKELYEKCIQYANDEGYSTVEEFITHTLEKELGKKEKRTQEGEDEIKKRLRGLGYIE